MIALALKAFGSVMVILMFEIQPLASVTVYVYVPEVTVYDPVPEKLPVPPDALTEMTPVPPFTMIGLVILAAATNCAG
jgi:hypothetical protein